MFNPNLMVKNTINHPSIHMLINVLARMLIAYIFIVAGWGKITGYEATIGYMAAMGVPTALLLLVILLELGGGIAIILGLQTRVIALALAGFSIISAILFHGAPDDAINFMKNLAMAGGLLILVLHGAGRLSVDYMLEK